MSSKKQSPTFCAYPWIEQVVQTTGEFSFCCVAKDGGKLHDKDGKNYFAARDKMEHAWNSDHMRELRRAMLAGEKIDACNVCYFQESIGKTSYRQLHNAEWERLSGSEIDLRIEECLKNDYKVSGAPLYLDLRLGNLCNLKCRSCNPYNSIQIHREAVHLLKEDEQFRSVYPKYFGDKFPGVQDWFEKDEFWDEVIAAIPNIRKVYLTGGEPTLIEKNYKFLNMCVESGHSKNIFLMFNTNCTNIQERFLELLPHFQHVLINASIDGYGSTNEYIRHLSRWETVDKNFQKLLQAKGNISIGATPVVQIYNVLNITEYLHHIEKLGMIYNKTINVDFLYAVHPECLDLSILPESIKALAAERLEKFRKRSVNYGSETFLTNSVDSCLNLLRNSSDRVSHEHLTNFITYTSSLDRSRKQSFAKQFPELHSMLGSEGYVL